MTWQSELRAWAVASAAAFCLGTVGFRVWTAPKIPDLTPTVTQANTALQGLPAVLTHLQSTSDAATGILHAATPVVAGLKVTEGKLNAGIDLTSHRINDLCPVPTAPEASIHPCGTLADTNRTLATLRGTSGQVERSLMVFNAHESELFVQERNAYAQMTKSVTDLDVMVTNPDLTAMIANGKTITGDAAAVTTDGRTWVHQKLYPTKTKGFVSGFEAAGDVAKHWMPPLL